MRALCIFVIVIIIISPTVFSQAPSNFNGIKMNEEYESVQKKLKEISKKIKTVTTNNPVFPLAKETESHIICTEIKTKRGIIEKAVFTFGDGYLKYIEAHGNVVSTLAPKPDEKSVKYLGYTIYEQEKLFIKKAEDIAWVLNDEAIHPNLFTWQNPYLKQEVVSKNGFERIPEFIKTGASLEEIKPILEANSDFTQLQKLDGKDPNAQIQINCFGVMYMGMSRKVEARFGNEELNVVWILTAKPEEDRIRTALIKQFGKPIYVNDKWEIFNDWQVGLRKDKPEVLLMKKEIGYQYKDYFLKSE